MEGSTIHSHYVDGVQRAAVHNGVARIIFMRLTADTTASAEVEILMPVGQIKELLTALSALEALTPAQSREPRISVG